MMEHTMVALIRNDPAAIARVVSLLWRRGFEIQSLAVERADGASARRATFVVLAADARRLTTQLMRLIDVIEVDFVGAGRTDVAELDPIRVAHA